MEVVPANFPLAGNQYLYIIEEKLRFSAIKK